MSFNTPAEQMKDLRLQLAALSKGEYYSIFSEDQEEAWKRYAAEYRKSTGKEPPDELRALPEDERPNPHFSQ